jgi:hypothetical protein
MTGANDPKARSLRVSGDVAQLKAEVLKLRKACAALALECHATKRAIFPTTNLSTAKRYHR